MSGHQADDLGQMELVAIAVGQEKCVARLKDAGVRDEGTTGRRTCHQSARARGLIAGKVIPAGGGSLDMRHQIIEGRLHLTLIDEIFNNSRAITLNGAAQVFCHRCCG